jgi:hypothetical protein
LIPCYLPGLKKIDEFVIRLGINEHYKSMSRGGSISGYNYFVAVVFLFNEATGWCLSANRKRSWFQYGVTWLVIVIAVLAGSFLRYVLISQKTSAILFRTNT